LKFDQGGYGVCGLACALYVLLKHDMPSARELFEATFHGYCKGLTAKKFKGADINLSDIPAFAKADDLYFDPKAPNLVDTTMARVLGSLLKKKAPDRYQSEQGMKWDHVVRMSETENWKMGNVPLRTNTLAYVLESILGFSVSTIAFRDDCTPADKERYMGPPLAINITYAPYKTLQEFFDLYRLHAAYSTSYVFAGLKALEFVTSTDFGDNEDSQLADYSPDKQDKQNPEALKRMNTLTDTTRRCGNDPYDHWVVVEKVVASPGNKVTLTLWTWGRQLSLRLSEASFLHTVHDVIFGEIKP
jgi:hypothetical protein